MPLPDGIKSVDVTRGFEALPEEEQTGEWRLFRNTGHGEIRIKFDAERLTPFEVFEALAAYAKRVAFPVKDPDPDRELKLLFDMERMLREYLRMRPGGALGEWMRVSMEALDAERKE